jgi:hypothetical protein
MDEEFQAVADEAIERAEAIDCQPAAFIAGLELMAQTLRERIESARGEFGIEAEE